MNPIMGQVEEKGLGFVSADEVHSFVSEEVRQILPLGILSLGLSGEIKMFSSRDDGFIKSALGGMKIPFLPEMPFAEHGCRIASLFQRLGDRDFLDGEFRHIDHWLERTCVPVKAINATDSVHPGARRVLAGHQRGTCGLAVLMMVVIGQPHPLGRQPINVGRFVILGAKARHIGVAQVISEDEDDVGPGRGRADTCKKGGEE